MERTKVTREAQTGLEENVEFLARECGMIAVFPVAGEEVRIFEHYEGAPQDPVFQGNIEDAVLFLAERIAGGTEE